jgi:hypothetical protein
VPRLSGRFATEWLGGQPRPAAAVPPHAAHRAGGPRAPLRTYGDFWQGVRLDIPGVASGELLSSHGCWRHQAQRRQHVPVDHHRRPDASVLPLQPRQRHRARASWPSRRTAPSITFNWMAQRPVRGVTERDLRLGRRAVGPGTRWTSRRTPSMPPASRIASATTSTTPTSPTPRPSRASWPGSSPATAAASIWNTARSRRRSGR